jgi:hypothetical protein
VRDEAAGAGEGGAPASVSAASNEVAHYRGAFGEEGAKSGALRV